MHRDHFNQPHQNNITIYRPIAENALCVVRIKNYPVAGKICVYANDKNSQAFGKIFSCFRHLAKDKILQPYITQKDLITSNNYPNGNPGYNLYVFDIRHHQGFSSAQPIKVKFAFRPAAQQQKI